MPARAAVLLVLMVAGALVAYKAASSLTTLAAVRTSGTIAPKTGWLASAELPGIVRPLVDSLNYFGWVIVALAFGVLLGAAVKAFVPRGWLESTVAGEGMRGQLAAAALGAPLMLCSCCAAPVFEGIYDRTKRLGPALALMLASPALNPAALTLTVLLFPARIALGRVVLSVVLVLLAPLVLERRFGSGGALAVGQAPSDCLLALEPPGWTAVLRSFRAALREVAVRSLPAIALGVVISAVLAGLVPHRELTESALSSASIIVLVAAVAVPLAMPTFAELPLGIALMHAGAPDGAVLALLIAGPAINLPSLFTLGKLVSARSALAAGVAVFAVAAAGGVIIGM